jgi:polyferredoxin
MSKLDKKLSDETKASQEQRGNNLLNNKILKNFIKSKWYPGIFQLFVGIVFAFIVFELLTGPDEAHDNFGTAGTWVLWWPILPILLFLTGRFWCAICPFGALSDVVQKWLIDAMFLAITWSDHVFGVVESPRGSGTLLLLITIGVIFSGAFWERRTWCRYLCFLGGLSGNYSRAGMLQLRGTKDICAKCTAAHCYKGSERAEGCPMFEFPKTMEDNAECNFCGNCVKNCPNNSIQISLRPPTKELWFIRKPRLDASFLAVVIMGIVFVQNITMLEIWDGMLAWLENVALLSITGLVAKTFNKASLKENFTKYGYALIPLDMAAHIAHNLFHLLAEGKSVFYTFIELFGVEIQHTSSAILDDPTIQAFQFILIAIGTLGSIYTVYKISKNNYESKKVSTTIVYSILLILLAVVNIMLFSLPMAMRM